MNINILLSGDGGQGIQTLSYLICTGAFQHGLEVSHIPNYGLEQKGGVSMAYIKISDSEITYPKFHKPDMLLIMSDQARERVAPYVQEGVEVIDIQDYREFFEQHHVEPYSRNVYFLSKIAGMLEEKGIVSKQEVFEALEQKLSKKRWWDENQRVWNL